MTDNEIILGIQKIAKSYNKPYEEINRLFIDDFNKLYEEERPWLCNIEDKTDLFTNKDVKNHVDDVIVKLKNPLYSFSSLDIGPLSSFTGSINTIVRVANRINNYKQGTKTTGDMTLDIPELFNQIKKSTLFTEIAISLPQHLKSLLPHLFSVVKHCQDPLMYPVYYKYWRNILREVFGNPDDYTSFCEFYRTFPIKDRHLNFGTCLLVIGKKIIDEVKEENLLQSKDQKAFKFLKDKVINVKRYEKYLDDLFPGQRDYYIIGSKYGQNASIKDVFPQMYKRSVIATGFASTLDLSSYYEDSDGIEDYLKQQGEENNSINALKIFLSLKPGDLVAVKADGSPKGDKGFLSIVAIAEVISRNNEIYGYDPDGLGHTINVRYIKAPVYKEFNVGGYGRTIQQVTNPTHIKMFFEGEYDIKKSVYQVKNISMELNTILYGPPGTGKTYQTINKALQITDPVYYQKYKNDREKLTKRFRELLIEDWNKLNGQIAFITFHQSMSYEDFIEGIKPVKPENSSLVHYEIINGIFKKLCIEATRNKRFTITMDGEERELTKELFEDFYYSFSASLPDHKTDTSPIKLKTKEGAPFELFRNSADSVVVKAGTRKTGMSHAFNELSAVLFKEKEPTYKSYEEIVINEILKDKELNVSEEDSSNKNYVLVIDEINRGNVSQIFGELITLIEEDKRAGKTEQLSVMLPYSKKLFSVPQNVYIVGTMNTADRSVEALDTALRRRFTFEQILPEEELLSPQNMIIRFYAKYPETDWNDKTYRNEADQLYSLLGIDKSFESTIRMNDKPDYADYSKIGALNDSQFNGISLKTLLLVVNKRLEALLTKDHTIGHAWLMNVFCLEELQSAFKNKIIPLLQEFFYNDYAKIGLVLGDTFVKQKKVGKNSFAAFNDTKELSADYEDKMIYILIDPTDIDLNGYKSIYK